jgi:hypothetical protein
MKEKMRKLSLLLALMALLAACAKKKKSDDFQGFGGVSYNAAPKSLSATLGLNIKVQAIDINYDGKMDGLYVCRTGGIRQFTVNASGSGYTNSPTVTLTPAGTCTVNPTAVSVVANGRVERIVITNSGSGCTSNSFNVTLSAPGAGTTATAQVTGASGGRVTRVSMLQKGSGYAAPVVTITGGGGSGATAGVNVAGGGLQNVYLLEPGDGLYTTQPTVTITGDTGAGADAVVAPADVIVSELDADGNCTVTYDPEDTNADGKRYIPQMLFTWPVTPTVGLDVNGDTNADYYLYTNADGTSQVMTNSDGSGAVAKLIVKNPMIDETNDLLYAALDHGQVIGFDVLNNNTIANNILGRIALDRVDPGYVDQGDPMPIISPIRNNEFYAAPMDVNILCSDRVACNSVTYSLGNGVTPVDPNFSSTNLDPTGVDYSGTMHAIKPGDSGTISFQNLPFGNYVLKYIVRDAAGRTSGIQQITFTIGRKPDISIISVGNRYVSNTAGTTASFQWTADTGSLTKPFRYLIAVNGSCIGYTRAQYLAPPVGVITGGPFTSGDTVTTNITATASGMLFNDTNHGINYITICAITCEVAACNAAGHLSVWGDAFETVIRDDTAPSITASPLSGMFSLPQQIFLSGSTTVAGVPANGSLIPNEICYTWGADASGNPTPATNPANPVFPCPAANNVVHVTGSSSTQLNLGCNSRASVTDVNANPSACPFTPGIYYLKFIARDAAGNVSPVQTQAYAIGVNPQITTITPAAKHVWTVANNWGNSATAVAAPRDTTTWQWQTDFPGTYQVRINDGTLDCTGGSLSSHAPSATGTVAALTPTTITINASDLNTNNINDVKICLFPSGGPGTPSIASRAIWRVQPKNMNTVYARVHWNKGETITFDVDADMFEPIGVIKSLTFTCPAGSTGVDANNACTLPSGVGAPNAQGIYTTYQIAPPLTNNVTTLAFNVAIELCDIAGVPSPCSPAAVAPSWGTATNGGTSTLKYFVLQNKTAGESIYVDNATGNDANPGTVRTAPKRSLSSAAAAATGGKAIYVIGGTYCGNGAPPCSATTGTLNLLTGTSIYGGFTSAWYRPDVAANRATITAGSNDSANSIGISLGAVNTPVFVEGISLTTQRPVPDLTQGYNAVGLRATTGVSSLTVYKSQFITQGDNVGAGGPNPGGSYGVHISGVNTVTLTSNTINAGQGWRGLSGGSGGQTGASGGNGGNGTGGIEGGVAESNDSHWLAPGGGGGAGGIAGFNGGGAGGTGGWQDDGGSGCGNRGGCDGAAGQNGGGAGGPRGTSDCNGNGGGGGNGATGGAGANAPAPAGAQPYGRNVGGFLVAYQGSTGDNGGVGLGGGGGGGGAGAECNLNDGGGGGGGGAGGGQQGNGGEGGHAGGPSVGIYLASISTINLSSNSVTRAAGGNAGNGQNGGGGGGAGTRGLGANGPDDGGDGGHGGFGGAGGSGGHGSGGYGGPSIGVNIVQSAAPTCSGNTYAGGGGGAAGTSAGNAGAAGTNANCFNFTSATAGAACTCN